MNEKVFDLLLQQSPIIIMLVIFLVFMYKYIMFKNEVIAKKDNIIVDQQNKLMQLYGDAIASQNKLSNVIEELRKDFARINH